MKKNVGSQKMNAVLSYVSQEIGPVSGIKRCFLSNVIVGIRSESLASMYVTKEANRTNRKRM